MLTQKEIAEFKREKEELEKKRLVLKEKVKNHREIDVKEVENITDELSKISERMNEISDQLKGTQTEKRGGITMEFEQIAKRDNEITKENFRNTEKYRDAFFRSFINKKISPEDTEIMAMGKRAVTDMNGLSVASGAEYLVPQTTLNQIQSVIVKYGQLYANVTKYNFNGDITIPIGTAGSPTGDEVDALEFTFAEVTINQQAVIATVSVKNLLLQNSISGLENYLAMEIGKYIGLQLEDYVLNGNPATSKFQGIIKAYGTSKKYSECSWELINDVYAAIDSPYGDNGAWIMNRKTFFSKFRSLTDAEGTPLIAALPVTVGGASASQYFIDGRPVIFSTRMADDAFIYGDLSQYVVNESQNIVIESDASAGFAADSTIWRGKVYAGGKVLFVEDAFVYYEHE